MAMICISGVRECDGCGRCFPDPPEPVCPVCGKECETLYQTKADGIIGCEGCVTAIDAWEYQSEN